MHHLLTLHLVLGLAARGTAAGPQGPPGDGPIIAGPPLLPPLEPSPIVQPTNNIPSPVAPSPEPTNNIPSPVAPSPIDPSPLPPPSPSPAPSPLPSPSPPPSQSFSIRPFSFPVASATATRTPSSSASTESTSKIVLGLSIAGGIIAAIVILGIVVYIYRKARRLDEEELKFDSPGSTGPLPPPPRYNNPQSEYQRAHTPLSNSSGYPMMYAGGQQPMRMQAEQPQQQQQQQYAQYETIGRPGLPGIVERSNGIVETPDQMDPNLYSVQQFVYQPATGNVGQQGYYNHPMSTMAPPQAPLTTTAAYPSAHMMYTTTTTTAPGQNSQPVMYH